MMWAQLFQAIGQGASADLNASSGYQNAMLSTDQAEYDAGQAEQHGQDQARVIRRVGRRVAGSQRAGYAASGVQIGEGSAGQVERETVTDTEHDAYQAILNGQRQALSLRTQAKLGRISARAAVTSALIDPLVASGMNSSAMSGWKTYNPNSSSVWGPSTTRSPSIAYFPLDEGQGYWGLSGGQHSSNDLSGMTRGSGD